MVERYVLAWLDKHGSDKVASFVYEAWLDAGGSFAPVRDLALLWLKQNAKNPDAVFVLKHVCQQRDLPCDTIKDIISWCGNFPDNRDSISRISLVLSRYATKDLQRPLVDCSLLVLERIKVDRLTDEWIRYQTLATIGTLAWKMRFLRDIESRLDAIHADIFRRSSVYSSSVTTPDFVLNPTLVHHVASMLDHKIIDPKTDRQALERFVDWLASWPFDRKPLLRPALKPLERNCPISELWNRVGIEPNLDELLERLRDMQMPPHDWSNLWEKEGWNHFPGEPRLVVLAQQWLRESAPDLSWPFVLASTL